MSNNGDNGNGRGSDGRFLPGNKFKAEIPYDHKLIRDSLKTNLYRAANFLNFTHTQANEFMERLAAEVERGIPSDITQLEVIIAEAVQKRNWPIIQSVIHQLFGKPAMTMNLDFGERERTMVDELTREQKMNAITAASKTMESA